MKIFLGVVSIDIGVWIFLGIVCVIIIVIGVFIFKIKRKLKSISQDTFGTDSLVKGYMQTKESLAETPRSLHAMTKTLLPAIERDFPEFDYPQFRSKAENTLRAYFNSIEAKDVSQLREVNATDIIIDKVSTIITDLESMDRVHTYDEITIYDTAISDYRKREGCCIIKLETSVGLYDYITDANGKIIGGDKKFKRQTVYEQELVYIQDPDKIKNSGYYSAISLSCPNCGAPIKKIGASKFCEYCGSGVKEINIRSWSFNDIREINNQTKKYY